MLLTTTQQLERWSVGIFALASEFLTQLSLLLRRSFRIVIAFISNDELLIQWNLTAAHLFVGDWLNSGLIHSFVVWDMRHDRLGRPWYPSV